ncbi:MULTISPECIES: gamma carbonic anhydrase family protein [Chryseobacterium]|uniref:Carbonic anhydrase/acetyltransferase-like protein (Isoleucine patch superfamily) n=1 Tax=Chryseobacterium camelliae TaxID=1265445 RepID=A0ABU0TK58_9FLAO|nr:MULTISPECIES: gamma carbonic anhydrase family protein [Chryseobacterium]MDT3408714.1 carbonic anhydrase/acetyltransferase-like protein (isoleucine patch superfamily) [Pseudacidovorax intermedius]MDQ1097433.1 carbonic anhydrase/acetyltransferase-like protein (isoleucine patch superfamily) [Chryseobacterium camelliae]MDQ1101361.1 carbonic anhydrase/acetyltransferase-like protein (isoleucine patch superfamily) [Chryseobacterium sp. SORGH_AS_1048]MDR6084806.1 carbonic anhydrase/acetyltransferase
MAIIRELLGKTPQIGEDTFLAETATVIGDVTMGKECSIWYNAVIRGDVNYIRMGDKVNVQDNAMLHCTYEKHPLKIGNNVSIGHNAIVHGCTIQDNVLIGMGAIVMDECLVEENSIVGAGSVVTQGTHIKSGEVWGGVPARKIKDLSAALLEGEVNRIADNYVLYSSWYKE